MKNYETKYGYTPIGSKPFAHFVQIYFKNISIITDFGTILLPTLAFFKSQ